MSYVYLASPYSGTIEEMEERYKSVRAAVAYFSKERHTVYSPIVHFHDVAREHSLPMDYSFWQQVNENMLRQAKELWVLTLPGWIISRGVQAEREFALQSGKPIDYVAFPNHRHLVV